MVTSFQSAVSPTLTTTLPFRSVLPCLLRVAWTLKYFFFLALFVVPPAFYDYSTIGFIGRAFIMWAIYLGLEIAFYFYARYAGPDPFFSEAYLASIPGLAERRGRELLWFVGIDFITRAIAYMAMAIANVRYKHNAHAALAAQFTGTIATILIYIVIRYTVFSGYNSYFAQKKSGSYNRL